MKKFLRPIALATAMAMLPVSMGCGYVLHPERRGKANGQIDPRILLFDCLWLIVGIIPGVVFLIVDATAGGLYGPSGFARSKTGKPNGLLAVRLPQVNQSTPLALKLVTPGGAVLDQAMTTVQPGDTGRKLTVDVQKATRLARQLGLGTEELKLQLTGPTGKTAELPLNKL
jgi:hypothetical protein